MVVLFSRHYGLFRTSAPAVNRSTHFSAGEELIGKQWLGVYYKGARIGYVHREIRKEGTGFILSEQMRMKLIVMKFGKEIETLTTAHLDHELFLRTFDFSLKADANLKIRGRVEAKRLVLTMETQGKTSEYSIQMSERPSLNTSLAYTIMRHGLRQGEKFSAAIFDPMTFNQENIMLEIKGKELLEVMGSSYEVFKIKGSLRDTDFFIWMTAEGEVLKEESPLGFMLMKETEQSAKEIKSSSDILAQVAVQFGMKLPPEVSYLRVRIRGVDLRKLELEGGRQHLERDVLEIRKEDLSKINKGNSEIPPDEYLKDTFFIQSKKEKIIALSREIVQNEKNRLRASGRINEWVYRNIRKVPAITFPMATEVLETKRGDCNEHATLFTALARSAGIPARIALGLTYQDGFFYYHAWPEIYSGQWIAVDPTLGQFPADASHIRLITGDIDTQAHILNVLGKIRIEGLEYRQ